MKTSSIIFKNVVFYLFLLTLILLGCNNQPKETSQAAEIKAYSPIEGNWEIVSSEISDAGKKKHPVKKQFKVFNGGYFSIIMFDYTGDFTGAGGGSYEVNGKTYKETFMHYSDKKYNGYSDWQEWKMNGDTLIFKGMLKSIMPDGKDVTNKADEMFTQKMVRIKTK